MAPDIENPDVGGFNVSVFKSKFGMKALLKESKKYKNTLSRDGMIVKVERLFSCIIWKG